MHSKKEVGKSISAQALQLPAVGPFVALGDIGHSGLCARSTT